MRRREGFETARSALEAFFGTECWVFVREKGGGGGGGSEEGAAPVLAVEELPGAIVRRVVKDKLAELSSGGGRRGGEEEINVHKDALLAFAKSAHIFMHSVSATANDICKESKRQTSSVEDVLKALEKLNALSGEIS